MIEISRPIDLTVLSSMGNSAHCLLPGKPEELILVLQEMSDLVPGEIVTVQAESQQMDNDVLLLHGDITGHRLDVAALDLTPLKLQPEGDWDPEEHYWGEPGEPEEEWEKKIKLFGPRPQFEFENILPGADPEDWDSDPIMEAVEARESGHPEHAFIFLMTMLNEDLRCLDAHAHLGNLFFDEIPELALRHYSAGVSIGELSLVNHPGCVLPYGLLDNRPFLRCLHGLGTILWRLGRMEDAERELNRLLWFTPADNQGARYCLQALKDGKEWTP